MTGEVVLWRDELEEKGRVIAGGLRGAGALPLGEGGRWDRALGGREIGDAVRMERLTRRELGDTGVGGGSCGRGLRGYLSLGFVGCWGRKKVR